LTLLFETLASLRQVSLLGPEGGQVVLFRLCPRQVELRQDCRILKYLTESIPDDGVEPLGAHMAGGTFRDPPAGEGKAALAVRIEILLLLTDATAMGGAHP
jgi:hypothetical protein